MRCRRSGKAQEVCHLVMLRYRACERMDTQVFVGYITRYYASVYSFLWKMLLCSTHSPGGYTQPQQAAAGISTRNSVLWRLVVAQLVKKLPRTCGIPKFIVPRSQQIGCSPCPEPDEPTPPHVILFPLVHILLFHLRLNILNGSFLQKRA